MTAPDPNNPLHDAVTELQRLVGESGAFTVVGDVRYESTRKASFDVEPTTGDTAYPWTVTLASGAGDSIDD